MTIAQSTLQSQVAACQAMLRLFHQERQQMQEQAGQALAAVHDNLQLKRSLAEGLAASVRQLGLLTADERGQADRQQMTAEIARLLEQLLVIDRENERTLRQHMEQASRPAATPKRPPRPGFSPGALAGRMR